MQHSKAARAQLPDFARLVGTKSSRTLRDLTPNPRLGTAIEVIASIAGLKALERDWRQLDALSGRSYNVFQSFEWVYAWAKTYAQAGSPTSIHVITGYTAGKLVFILPLMRTRSGPVSVLRWLSEPFGQYGDILLANTEDATVWMTAAWSFIKTLPGVDVVRLRHVREDATIFPYLSRHFGSARVPEGAPFMDLSQFQGDEAYEQRYSKDQRKRRKKIRAAIEEVGPVTFTIETTAEAIPTIIRHKQKWLQERKLFSRALACPKIAEFLKEVIEASGQQTKLVTSTLSAGLKPVSWEIGLRYKDRHCGFITAHDPAFTQNSPGRLHMDLSQRRALADGYKVFDLMIPKDTHKDTWASGVMPVDDYYRAVSVLGWVYGRIYLEIARPLMRHAYYNSSTQLRTAVGKIGNFKALFMR